MKLVRNINSTYVEVKRNLKILEQEGLVTDKHVGRLRMIKLNQENPKTTINRIWCINRIRQNNEISRIDLNCDMSYNNYMGIF